MRYYRKQYQDVCDISKWPSQRKFLDSQIGSLDELALRMRNFYKETHLSIFDYIVKEVWFEQQLLVGNSRRTRRVGNGVMSDAAFGRFTKIAVGISHRIVTISFWFTPIGTYLRDFFPDFLFHDPFKNPEKYKFPYKHVTLDHMVFVYQMENRLELLAEAEKRKMTYAEFINWAHNWAYCYNDEMNRKKNQYQLIGGTFNWPYIRNNKLKKFWENERFNFNVKK